MPRKGCLWPPNIRTHHKNLRRNDTCIRTTAHCFVYQVGAQLGWEQEKRIGSELLGELASMTLAMHEYTQAHDACSLHLMVRAARALARARARTRARERARVARARAPTRLGIYWKNV